ncbi:MAG: hypothetical protein ACD_64C00163G0005 [uncultured bacterium]|nr:MAG: hypothetical protein ACD_64C00163G0005 [uncultured bacterium]HLE76202.1 rhodanese-related sulfurtransferase [Candidatus Babeliales bacterium]
MGKILLYYKYIAIEYPQRICKWQKKICGDLKLHGRIFIGSEGINGTVGGEDIAIERYVKLMHEHPLFSDIDFKYSDGDASYFPRMEIKVRKEICKLGVPAEELTVKDGGIHLEPEQVHELILKKPDDLIILDTRNNFESRIGTFTGSITPDITNFRDLPKFIDENSELFENKQVLMHCTGGVRCERATAYLKKKGIAKEVFQIRGGIVRYTEKYPEGFFRGKNYVFDRRVAVRVNDDVLSDCDLCHTPCDTYTNCVNMKCNSHYISCQECVAKTHNTCSDTCMTLVVEKKVPIRVPFQTAPEQRVVPAQ